LHCKYPFEKWYWEKVKEELEWEEEVEKEVKLTEEIAAAD